jgi:class 3 adenylate cyclase
VLFCDLVGSTALANRLDAEDLRDVIRTYHKCCADIVSKFEGSIAQYLGDGVMARFGYPKAHEDDADRAVRCGLDMIKAVSSLKTPNANNLEVRIGIATGVVVVGDQSTSEVGETPNLAARLQSLAQPGSIIIADSTKKLIGGLFECRDIGAVTVKGYNNPILAWQVLALSQVESRFEALRSQELTPLVGRDEELALLMQRWLQAKDGKGRVVLLSGEPGIGKSRLVAAFAEQIADESHTRLQYFFSPYDQTSALYPVIGQLGHAAAFNRDDDATARYNKLAALLARTATSSEDVALVADLLSVPVGDRYPALHLTPQQHKDKTFAALLRQFEALTRERPVMMVFEDVHWIDPSSRELLDLTIDRIQGLPILLLITFRPEFEPPWSGQSRVTTLVLNRLDRPDGTAMVRRMLGTQALPEDVVDDIVERTDGVPLFLEELTKAILESGVPSQEIVSAVPATKLAVPATLHASLMARLDRLGTTAKQTAQVGAAIGRVFSYELLVAAAERPEKELQVGLDQLVGAGLMFQRGAPPRGSYLFSRTRSMAPCCVLSGRGCMLALHWRSKKNSQTRWKISLKFSPTISLRRVGSTRRWRTGYKPDGAQRGAQRTLRPLHICGKASPGSQPFPRALIATDMNWPSSSISAWRCWQREAGMRLTTLIGALVSWLSVLAMIDGGFRRRGACG